ncbi:MAG TPA: hypothetical protein VFZ29_03775 [Solirubrobacterales bacterium]
MLAISLLGASPVKADTLGSNLASAPNDSVCKFQVFEPKTQVCTVAQSSLTPSHTGAGGLTVPFDGIVVKWSVVSGPVLPGTGKVTMALRATEGPGYMEKGPEVELPLGSPGTRYTYPERLPVTAGQPLGLRIAVENRSIQEAGAPIAFAEPGVGTINFWWGEPESAIWDEEAGVELLLDAEIEPDADHDGYGDLTQDCFPGHPGDQHLCGQDLAPPAIQARFAKQQAFLRSGAIVVRVGSSEAGLARASGELQIKGRGGRTYSLGSASKSLVAGGQAVLRLRVRHKVLKAARVAAAEGRRSVVTGRVGVRDASGNEGQAPIRVRSVAPKAGS